MCRKEVEKPVLVLLTISAEHLPWKGKPSEISDKTNKVEALYGTVALRTQNILSDRDIKIKLLFSISGTTF